MADTRQVVSWSLERTCVFRHGDNWFHPRTAFHQLADLRTVANAQSDSRVIDGICVTGWTKGQDYSGAHHDVPSSGFKIEQRLSGYGGLSAALATCRKCEANADNELGIKVAGCYGWLKIWPDSQELDEQLWKIIEAKNLDERLQATFPVTTPLWYGFWMKSPLQRLQATFLYDLLDPACDHGDPKDRDVVHFLNALKVAISWELSIHVSLAPPGHTDFGWYTMFPHCPRCKAEARVGRWKERYPSDPYVCQVCGHTFNPNEHHSSEQDSIDWSADSLEKQLGDAGYEAFKKRFLIARGCTAQQADEVIDNQNNGPLVRKISSIRKQRKATLRTFGKRSRQRLTELAPYITLALTDDVPLELVLVPSGQFLMGDPPSENGAFESYQHVVQFGQPFYIGRFPVTQAQWAAVMGKNPSYHKGDPDLPVDQASWIDCQEFCDVLSNRQKRIVRLPSEAEWEYACRAGTTSVFAFGDTLSPDQANFTPFNLNVMPGELATDEEELIRSLELAAETPPPRRPRPTPVGSYPPNTWGIYDMHGNVQEWCEDVWHYSYDGAPTDGSAWLDGEDKTPFRVVRGGWCSASESACTSASRQQLRADAGSPPQGHEEAADKEEDAFLESILEMTYTPHGFRIVCEVD